jgi:hypothetical protein
MKIIELTRGKSAMVDDEDFEYLSQWKWFCSSGGYAVRSVWANGKVQAIYMHREIVGAGSGQVVDHKDGNRVNNQRSNLRGCTSLNNNANRKKSKGKSSQYKGVSYFALSPHHWMTRIKKKNKQVFIGYFENERHAALAYDLWAKDLHGEYARLNII